LAGLTSALINIFSTLCQQPSNRLSDIMLGIKSVRKAGCTCIRLVRE
jgi:hypothetical protein